MPWPGVSCWC
ncbi:unnamed protein product [Linum tenue]|uniref:Uncharacterized protein n=1 Tax=Linum tenue TaxID=586396 RepID=A0AAV0NDE1_9ROSI|nr:unnamed protein product [Linum tenue]